MADAIMLSCPSCGAQLQITEDVERFACLHCGNEQIVRRSGGIVSLAPVVEGLGRVQRGTDKTAAELAIPRLKGEIEEISEHLEALNRRLLYWQTVSLNDIRPATLTEYAFAVMLILSTVLAFGSFVNQSLWCSFWLLLVIAGLVGYIRNAYVRRSKAQADIDAQIEQVKTEIRETSQFRDSKIEALNRNKAIADSP